MSPLLLRHLMILRLIPRAPRKIAASDIEAALRDQGIDINVRSIQRDLTGLSGELPLVCDDKTKPFGWSWTKDAESFFFPGMSPETALTLKLVGQYFDTLLPRPALAHLKPHLDVAGQVLERADRFGSWLGKVRILPRGQPLLPPAVKTGVLDVVYGALLDGKRCELAYRKAGESEPTLRRVNPLGLVLRGPVPYLVCNYVDDAKPRTLLIHRIESAKPLGDAARAPDGFQLDAFIRAGEFGYRVGQKTIRLAFLVEKRLGGTLRETALARGQEIEERGDELVVRAEVPDTQDLRAFLWGFADKLEVLEPAELRAEFREIARKIAARYEA